MKIVCFPHFYYLSKVSRLVEIGHVLRRLGQEVILFIHGGGYEHVARQAGFDVVAVAPEMSPGQTAEYITLNHGEQGNPFRESFFTDGELQAYVPAEADTSLRENILGLKALQDKLDDPAIVAREIMKFLGVST